MLLTVLYSKIVKKIYKLAAVIRFCLDFKAEPNEKSHNCCKLGFS